MYQVLDVRFPQIMTKFNFYNSVKKLNFAILKLNSFIVMEL